MIERRPHSAAVIDRGSELPTHGDVEVKVVTILSSTGFGIISVRELELEVHVALFIEHDVPLEIVVEAITGHLRNIHIVLKARFDIHGLIEAMLEIQTGDQSFRPELVGCSSESLRTTKAGSAFEVRFVVFDELIADTSVC